MATTKKNKPIPISAKEVDELANSDTKSLLPITIPSPSKQFTSTVLFIIVLHICLVLFGAIAFCFFFSFYTSSSSHVEVSRPLTTLQKPVVILISLDGFRFDYLHKTHLPNINKLRKTGTEAKDGLIPVFPTLTFPNHYSIATGLYPAYHGIVDNYFSDPDVGEKYIKGNSDPKWWLGEPLWETAVKRGLKAMTYFWPGSEVKKGSWDCPEKYCKKYAKGLSFEERVDNVLKYFDMDDDDIPSLIALYFEDPDTQGHLYGPDDSRITDAVARMDKIIGRLIKGLEERKIFENVNIILLGDHGMVGTCDAKMIYLDDLAKWTVIQKEWVDSYGAGLSIRPPTTLSSKDIVSKLNEGLKSLNQNDHLKVYLKEDLPPELHYSGSNRISPIIGLVDEGFKVRVTKTGKSECGGAHGYNNKYFSMRSIFIAHGPRFARGKKVKSFENVEIYNLVTKLLKIEGAKNNGTTSFWDGIITPSK